MHIIFYINLIFKDLWDLEIYLFSILICRWVNWWKKIGNGVLIGWDYDDEYILDRDDEDYILLKLINEYISSDIPPEKSSLMICYKLFCSSIELMFCFKLILSFPKYSFMKKENEQINEYFIDIKKRVELFFDAWCATHWNTYQKNKLIKDISNSL